MEDEPWPRLQATSSLWKDKETDSPPGPPESNVVPWATFYPVRPISDFWLPKVLDNKVVLLNYQVFSKVLKQ